MDSTKLIVSKAFERVEEYRGNAVYFINYAGTKNTYPDNIITKRGEYNIAYILPDFHIVSYKDTKITKDISTLDGFNLLDMKEILTILLMNLPLEFSGITNKASSYIPSPLSPRESVRDAIKYVDDKIKMFDSDDMCNFTDLIDQLNKVKSENERLKKQVEAIRSMIG